MQPARPSSRGAPPPELGRIVAHYGVAVVVRLDGGEARRVRMRRGVACVVGERVELLEGDRLRVLPSHGVLRRRDTRGRVRVIAANLDVLGVVLSAVPASPLGFVDRGIVAARAASIEPFLVVNKSDQPGCDELIASLPRCHREALPLYRVSAVTGEGLDALRAELAPDRRAAFVGTSGVGKSSLLNALCPDLELSVGEINEVSGLGRHVTSNATLHRLPSGGELIDTPGFRDFGPVEISPGELARGFPGFERALEAGCRFRDCKHRGEPGCAVGEAIARGEVEPERERAYLDLLDELERAERASRRY